MDIFEWYNEFNKAVIKKKIEFLKQDIEPKYLFIDYFSYRELRRWMIEMMAYKSLNSDALRNPRNFRNLEIVVVDFAHQDFIALGV